MHTIGQINHIEKGRVATQMPGFADKLSSEEIAALVEYIYSPAKEDLGWGLAEMNASHIQHNDESRLSDKPVFKVDDLLKHKEEEVMAI